MLEEIIALDQQLLIYLNNLYHPVADPIMYWFSDKYIWFPMYAYFVGYLLYKYKWNGLFMVIATAITIAACDQFTSSFMKPFFERLRPCYEPGVQEHLRMITTCGGKYGFASSHAANAFGFAVFAVLLLYKKYKKILYLLFWAALVSYSRVYLGVHYPLDIITGGIVGSLIAYFVFLGYKKLTQNRQKNKSSAF
jgi:undecaprenyl-diphosphatase